MKIKTKIAHLQDDTVSGILPPHIRARILLNYQIWQSAIEKEIARRTNPAEVSSASSNFSMT